MPSRAPVRLQDIAYDVLQLPRQRATVGVAQRDHIGAGLGRYPYYLQRVRTVGAVAVEEVLGVEEDPLPVLDQVPDGVGDHPQVLVQGGPQRPLDVRIVALGNECDDRGAGVAQRGDLWVVGRGGGRLAGRAERGEGRVPQVQLGPRPLEELGVLGYGARPATLDESDARGRPGAARWRSCRPRTAPDPPAARRRAGWCRRRGTRRRCSYEAFRWPSESDCGTSWANKKPPARCERSARSGTAG